MFTDGIGGIRYPGDDGSEPEHIRDEKARAYARDVIVNAERMSTAREVRHHPTLWMRIKHILFTE